MRALVLLILCSISCGNAPLLKVGMYDVHIVNVRDTTLPLWNQEGREATITWRITHEGGQYILSTVNREGSDIVGDEHATHVVFTHIDRWTDSCVEGQGETSLNVYPSKNGVKGNASYLGHWSCDPADLLYGPFEVEWLFKGKFVAEEVDQ